MRVPMTMVTPAFSVDQFTIAFVDMTDQGGKIAMSWEKTRRRRPVQGARLVEVGRGDESDPHSSAETRSSSTVSAVATPGEIVAATEPSRVSGRNSDSGVVTDWVK